MYICRWPAVTTKQIGAYGGRVPFFLRAPTGFAVFALSRKNAADHAPRSGVCTWTPGEPNCHLGYRFFESRVPVWWPTGLGEICAVRAGAAQGGCRFPNTSAAFPT